MIVRRHDYGWERNKFSHCRATSHTNSRLIGGIGLQITAQLRSDADRLRTRRRDVKTLPTHLSDQTQRECRRGANRVLASMVSLRPCAVLVHGSFQPPAPDVDCARADLRKRRGPNRMRLALALAGKRLASSCGVLDNNKKGSDGVSLFFIRDGCSCRRHQRHGRERRSAPDGTHHRPPHQMASPSTRLAERLDSGSLMQASTQIIIPPHAKPSI